MKGPVLPGMSIEVSGPPGSGKTVIAIALALSARVSSDEDEVGDRSEALLIGQLPLPVFHCVNGVSLTLGTDTEGSLTRCRLRAAAESISRSPGKRVLRH